MAIYLIRHTEIARAWKSRCYGQSDVPLSRAGQADIARVVQEIAALGVNYIIHSGMRRTRLLAEKLSATTGVPLQIDHRWRERDFGSWEGMSWNAIYRETGNAMDEMIDAPDIFRPGGGETTMEMQHRVRAACADLPKNKISAVITHGGPIAALLGTADQLPVRNWLSLVPKYGGWVSLQTE
jgi:broad specificity phosphatase PhoE